MFAVHQVQEGMVWLALEGRLSPLVGQWFVWLHILFAHAFLIALAPWSIWLVEPDEKRWRLLFRFWSWEHVSAALPCGSSSHGQIIAQIRHQGIEYEDSVTCLWWFAVLYVTATCVPPFLSSYPWMVTFGALNLAGLIVAALFKQMYVTSVWCAFTALLSVLVYLHFCRVRRLMATQAFLAASTWH